METFQGNEEFSAYLGPRASQTEADFEHLKFMPSYHFYLVSPHMLAGDIEVMISWGLGGVPSKLGHFKSLLGPAAFRTRKGMPLLSSYIPHMWVGDLEILTGSTPPPKQKNG